MQNIKKMERRADIGFPAPTGIPAIITPKSGPYCRFAGRFSMLCRAQLGPAHFEPIPAQSAKAVLFSTSDWFDGCGETMLSCQSKD
jgi:hypothetical protein